MHVGLGVCVRARECACAREALQTQHVKRTQLHIAINIATTKEHESEHFWCFDHMTYAYEAC